MEVAMPERNHAAHVIRESTERLQELARLAPQIAAEIIRITKELEGAACALELAYQRDVAGVKISD
jgi:hypothetical protein